MTTVRFDFDHEKANEVILYFAQYREKMTGASATIRDIFKLMYFADRISLQEYGRFLCNDNYVAMKQGPVPSDTYNLIKSVKDRPANVAEKHGFKIYDGYHIHLLRDADLDYLSESDVMCMDKVLEDYGAMPSQELMEKSHDKVWEQAWQSLPEKGSVPIEVSSIIETLEDSENLLSYLTGNDCD